MSKSKKCDSIDMQCNAKCIGGWVGADIVGWVVDRRVYNVVLLFFVPFVSSTNVFDV